MANPLNYHRPALPPRRPAWKVTMVLVAGILTANALLVLLIAHDRSWGALWILLIGMPILNLILAIVSLAFTPVVRELSNGASVTPHVLASILVPIGAG